MGSVELVLRKGDRFTRPFVLKRPLGLTDESSEQLMDEARIGGLIDDPRVVSVLDVGNDDRGMYLVMEYVNGATLAELLVRLHETGAVLSVACAALITEQLALGLHSAHELTDGQGRRLELVHRDVSPQNVLLDFSGRVRLTDFGIALAAGRAHQTGTGLIRGKAGYLAPEQMSFSTVDRRADLFALGVVLYESLTRRRLFGGTRSAHVIDFDLSEFRSDVPAELEELLYQLLAQSPDQRPASGEEVALRLAPFLVERRRAERELADLVQHEFGDRRQALEHELATALNATELQRPVFSGRRRWVLAAGVGAMAAAAVLYGLAPVSPAEDTSSPEPANRDVSVHTAVPDDETGVPNVAAELTAAENTSEAIPAKEPNRRKRLRGRRRGSRKPPSVNPKEAQSDTRKPAMWEWKD